MTMQKETASAAFWDDMIGISSHKKHHATTSRTFIETFIHAAVNMRLYGHAHDNDTDKTSAMSTHDSRSANCKLSLFRLPPRSFVMTFKTCEVYQHHFGALLLEECRAQIKADWHQWRTQDTRTSSNCDSCAIETAIHSTDGIIIRVRGRFQGVMWGERTVVVIEIAEEEAHHSKKSPMLGIIIERVTQGNVEQLKIQLAPVSLTTNPTNPTITSKGEQTKVAKTTTQSSKSVSTYTNPHTSKAKDNNNNDPKSGAIRIGTNIVVKSVSNLTSSIRQVEGLQSIAESPLLPYILPQPDVLLKAARNTPVSLRRSLLADESKWSKTESLLKTELNIKQLEAVCCALDDANPIVLVQGPPGTGKSKTLVAMLAAMFFERNAKTSNKSASSRATSSLGTSSTRKKGPRVLVCAPSNAAVDEIVRRVAKGLRISPGSPKVSVNFVRTGNPKQYHESIIPFSLDYRVEQRLNEASQQLERVRKQLFATQSEFAKYAKELAEVDAEIKMKSKFLNLEGGTSLSGEIRQLQSRKSELEQTTKTIGTQGNEFAADVSRAQKLCRDEEKNCRLAVLECAQIVFTTLNSSAYELLRRVRFDCVVVDEAAQCIEPELLVPLTHGSPKLIMFGDHKQLAATVLSRVAEKHGLGRSCFERMYEASSTPVARCLLSIQYRMHPAICQFPNKAFYNSQLQTHISIMVNEACQAPAWTQDTLLSKRYTLFDAPEGKEMSGGGDSKYNLYEATLVTQLVRQIGQYFSDAKDWKRVAVITPYSSQKTQICDALFKALGDVSTLIGVDTVDGFQGQEREVIIFSCVRSGNVVGFLSEQKRLNVALTRAKHGLFIIGKTSTLKMDPLWKRLVEDASERGLVQSGAAIKASGYTKKVAPRELKSATRGESIATLKLKHRRSQGSTLGAPRNQVVTTSSTTPSTTPATTLLSTTASTSSALSVDARRALINETNDRKRKLSLLAHRSAPPPSKHPRMHAAVSGDNKSSKIHMLKQSMKPAARFARPQGTTPSVSNRHYLNSSSRPKAAAPRVIGPKQMLMGGKSSARKNAQIIVPTGDRILKASQTAMSITPQASRMQQVHTTSTADPPSSKRKTVATTRTHLSDRHSRPLSATRSLSTTKPHSGASERQWVHRNSPPTSSASASKSKFAPTPRSSTRGSVNVDRGKDRRKDTSSVRQRRPQPKQPSVKASFDILDALDSLETL